MNQMKLRTMMAAVVAATGCSLMMPADGSSCSVDNRPYEFKDADRTEDDVPPLVDFEDRINWKTSAKNAEARCSVTRDVQLFGRNTLRFEYAGRGDDAEVSVSPPEPIPLPDRFDTLYVWLKGNHWGRGANTDFSIPTLGMSVRFRRHDGREMRLPMGRITWQDWHQVNIRLTVAQRAELKGGTFDGFSFTGGTQREFLPLHLDNIAVFADDLSSPIAVAPRARRNITPLPGANVGINTGKGVLPFPTREETILPNTSAPKDGDLLPVFSGGVLSGDAAALRVTQRRAGKSLVVDLYAPAGKVTKICTGRATEAKAVRRFKVPYLAYSGKGHLTIELLEGGWYRSALFDWYRSNASRPAFTQDGMTMEYLPRTDGTFNEVSERIVITLSRDFTEVLPEIPNPPSPYKAITGRNAWRSHGTYDHGFDEKFWREVRRQGIRHVVVTDHETMWRDRGDSFTFRTNAAPGRGGDAGALAYARFMRQELGYVYGPYNNYTDFAPVNAYWRRNRASRDPDGSFQPAWMRCYAPKPVLVPALCEEIAPRIQAKFGFNAAYCDVHTSTAPWDRTDYDARVPGAGTFAQTFYAWGEVLLIQRKVWGGPVYSEGPRHFMYSGLTDGNYAQDCWYDFLSEPWIVDFDLLKIHPKECNFGMGNLGMFAPSRKPDKKSFKTAAHGPTEKARDELIDLFLTATVAFGHAPYLILDYCFDPPKPFGLAYGPKATVDMAKGLSIAVKSYAMVQPIAARYTQVDVKRIAYFDADGIAHTSSEAIASGIAGRNQILVEYQDGTLVLANGGTHDCMRVEVDGRRCEVPPRAFKAWTSDGKVRAEIWEDSAGVRHWLSESPEFTYRDGTFTLHERAE